MHEKCLNIHLHISLSVNLDTLKQTDAQSACVESTQAQLDYIGQTDPSIGQPIIIMKLPDQAHEFFFQTRVKSPSPFPLY